MRVFFCTVALLVCASLLRPSTSFAQTSSLLVLDSAAIAESGARTLAELLAARVPGVDVTWLSGAPGFAAHVSVRGAPGGTGSGRPNLYVDGTLLRDDEQWFGARPDGQSPAHYWDLPVEDLYEVRVVLGASGGAALELGSSRGAVVVTTRRPGAGQWSGRTSARVFHQSASPAVPALNSRMGTWSGGGETNVCNVRLEASGQCTPTGPIRLQPFGGENPFASATGGRIAMSAGGGLLGAALRVGVVGDVTPGAVGERFERMDFSVAATRAITHRVMLSADVRAGVLDGEYVSYADMRRFGALVRMGPDSGLGTPGPSVADLRAGDQQREARSLFGSTSASVRVGRADVVRVDLRTERFDRSLERPTFEWSEFERRGVTLGASYEAPRRLRRNVEATWRVAAWRQDARIDERWNGGTLWIDQDMNTVLIAAGVNAASRRGFDVALRSESSDRLPAWPAGENPLASASAWWVVTDESWMPRVPVLPRWRLGFAYGESTDQQALVDAIGKLLSGASLGVSAERALEREASVEASSASGRLTLIARAFERRVTGSHMRVPESVVMGFSSRLRPDVPLETFGGELALRFTRPIGAAGRLEATAWVARAQSRFGDVPFALSYLSLGDHGYTLVGARQRYGGIPQLTLAFADTSGDGVITTDEVTPPGLASVHASTPTHTSGLVVSVREFGGWSAGFTIDGKFGHRRYDIETAEKCLFRLCDELFTPGVPLERQALIAGFFAPSYVGDFARVRELWLRRRIAVAGARAVSLSLVGQNLLTWTRFPGRDPEVSTYQLPGISAGESGQEPVRPALSLRVDIGGH